MKAKWRNTAGTYGDATEIASHLEHLRSQAELTAISIVEDAENTSSPLHRFFEWDESAAAEKYRRKQASNLISRIARPDGRRLYAKVPRMGDTPAHFDLVTRVLKNPELRRPFARRGLMELRNWETRYQDFPELREAVEALQAALKNVIRPALKEMETV